jgi:hypothetical protein
MKVYLSSTYRDLHAHRVAVDRTLRKMGHDVIGMEQYAAESSRPVERCKRDVEVADAYVLILGWRYGYVPTQDNDPGHSVTEIEYRHARHLKKRILAFLLDPEIPWPPSSMDSASADARAAAAISDLRTEVGAEYLVGMFGSPEDLASQVAAAVASHGLTTQLSELVLNRTAVSADSMGGFGTGHPMQDTSLDMIKDLVAKAGKDRAIVVSLGEGDQWWSTRLFLFASLLRSVTQVRQIVFCGRGGRFAEMASPDALLDGLGARFLILDLVARQVRESQSTEDRMQETDRQLAVWEKAFSEPQQWPRAASKRAASTSVTQVSRDVALPTTEREAQVGVREELLLGWLGERLITRCIEVQGNLTMPQVQQIIDCLVPRRPAGTVHQPEPPGKTNVKDPDPSIAPSIKVIDRDSFALELAREWVREGLPHSPAT